MKQKLWCCAVTIKGKEYYEIHCRLCHGTAGFGDGHIPSHGFPYGPPSYHSAEARRLKVEEIMAIAKNGKGIMLGFGDRLKDSTLLAIAPNMPPLDLSPFRCMGGPPGVPLDASRIRRRTA